MAFADSASTYLRSAARFSSENRQAGARQGERPPEPARVKQRTGNAGAAEAAHQHGGSVSDARHRLLQ